MPNTLLFDKQRNWKVALTSISHPNKFSTFAGEKRETSIYLRPSPQELTVLTFNENQIYTKEEIIFEINTKFGAWLIAKLDSDGKMEIDFKIGVLYIGNNLCNVFGYKGLYGLKTATLFNTHELIKFEGGFDLHCLAPDYIIAYCNVVQPSIIGGEYSNILRIASIPTERSEYVIQEFKNKNFLPLLNTEISEIEINFRSHDGSLTNFIGDYDIIMNLEFSNNS